MTEHTRDPLRRAFGRLVRSHREALGGPGGLTREAMAARMDFSAQWIEKLETGQRAPSEKGARALDEVFGTEETALFLTLYLELKAAGRHVELPLGFVGFVELEGRAAMMSIFENMVITGLFQTPEYAGALLARGRRPSVVEDKLEIRMGRMALLEGDDPPDVVFLVDEAALRRIVGSAEIMREQIRHLIELAKRPNITLQVVPLEAGGHQGVNGAFTILEFDPEPEDERPDSTVVYVEGHGEGHVIDAPDRVRSHAISFSLIRGDAASARESLTMLETILETL